MKNDIQLKQELFEMAFFENRVVRYRNPVDKKYVDVVLVCKNKSLQGYFEHLFRKYKLDKKMSFNDFMLEFACYHSFMTLMKFEIRNEGTFQDILDGTDVHNNMGRLITTIKNALDGEVIHFVNDGLKMTTRTVEGNKNHVGFNINYSSLDVTMPSESGEDFTLMSMLSEDNTFWGDKGEQLESNSFVKWYKENAKSILTASQHNLVKKLEQIGYGKYEVKPNDLENIIGFPVFKLNTKLNNIAVRVAKAWEKERVMVEETQLARQVRLEVTKWTELFDILADDENIADMNKEISNFFLTNIDNRFVNPIIYDNLNKEDTLLLVSYYQNGEQIASKILYKLVELAEKRLDKLQAMDTTSVKFYKKESEILGGWTKEKYEQYNKDLKAWKEQPCKVYKLVINEDGTYDKGEFLREEPFKKFEGGKTQYVNITPTGIAVNAEQLD